MTLFEMTARDAMHWVMEALSAGMDCSQGRHYAEYAVMSAEKTRSNAQTADEKRVANDLLKLTRNLAEPPNF